MLNARLRSGLAILGSLLILQAAACSSDDGGDTDDAAADTGGGGTPDAGDGGGGGTPDGSGDDSGGTVDCPQPESTHTNLVYRVQYSDQTFPGVDPVTILQPGGVGIVLQGLINSDIDLDLLHILISSRNFQAECGATTLEATGNAGTEVSPGVYDWFPGVVVEYQPTTISAAREVANQEDISLIFPAIIPGSTDTLPIPAENIRLVGTFVDGANGPELAARLTGVIFEDAIAELPPIAIGSGEPAPLASLLGEDNINFEADGRRGWILEADIIAAPVTVVDGFFDRSGNSGDEGSGEGSGQ
jgi:hypothetical protein